MNLTDAAARVLSRSVLAAGGCLVWQGCVNSKGYGCIAVDGKSQLTHRVVWEAQHGPIPDGMTVDHLCRIKRCANAEHFEIVTRPENARRGSPGTTATHCKRNHELAGENLIVKKNYNRGTLMRNCRRCTTATQRAVRFHESYFDGKPTREQIDQWIAAEDLRDRLAVSA